MRQNPKTTGSEALGFGFVPSESAHYFIVEIGSSDDEGVTISEHFSFNDGAAVGAQDASDPKHALRRKVTITLHKWLRIADELRAEFNRRLRQRKLKPSAWITGENYLSAPFGKELTLLCWAIEDADPSVISIAYANWEGLAPEERWWLYTTINATSGHPEHHRDRGWRKAIRIALTENPVGDRPFRQYDDLLDEQTGALPVQKKTKKKKKVDAEVDQLSMDDLDSSSDTLSIETKE